VERCSMNKIEAIIRPEKLTSVKDALAEAGLVGLNVVQVAGKRRQRGVLVGSPRGVGSHVVDMLPKLKLERVVTDGDTQKAIDIIIAHARNPAVKDGYVGLLQLAGEGVDDPGIAEHQVRWSISPGNGYKGRSDPPYASSMM